MRRRFWMAALLGTALMLQGCGEPSAQPYPSTGPGLPRNVQWSPSPQSKQVLQWDAGRWDVAAWN